MDSYQTHDDLIGCSFLSPEVPNLSPLGTVPYFNFFSPHQGTGPLIFIPTLYLLSYHTLDFALCSL